MIEEEITLGLDSSWCNNCWSSDSVSLTSISSFRPILVFTFRYGFYYFITRGFLSGTWYNLPKPGLLAILTGPNQGRTFFLPLHETVSIGSAFDSWASLPHDPRLSGHHCTIRYDGEYFHLCDLNSHQGTLVHGINITSIGPVPLPVGEHFTTGDSTFQLRWWPPEILRTLREQSEPLLALIDASRNERIWPLLNHSGAHYSCLLAGTRAQSLAA